MAYPIAQTGMPGGMELLVMAVTTALAVAVLVGLTLLVLRFPRDRPAEDRLEKLETEVASLRDRIDDGEQQ